MTIVVGDVAENIAPVLATVEGTALAYTENDPATPVTGVGGLLPVAMASPLWGSVDSMMNQMDDTWSSQDDVFTVPSTYMTIGLTAGYITWLLKAGYLSASMLSVIPLWREFDPLMVLAKPKEKKRKFGRKDKDSCESNDIDAERIFESSVQTETSTAGESAS